MTVPLVERVLSPVARERVLAESLEFPRWTVSEPLLHDAELIATGGYSPLDGFLGSEAVESVIGTMHLPSGRAWALPIVLPVDDDARAGLREGDTVLLRGGGGDPVAVLAVDEFFRVDRRRFAAKVFGTEDAAHPGVAAVLGWPALFASGRVQLITPPSHEFPEYNLTPAETREEFARRGWRRVAGFQTRNPVHRAHEYIQKCALEICDGLYLNPLVGWTKEGDIPAGARMRSYEVLVRNHFPRGRVVLGTLCAAMRYAGPREAVHHALVRRNFGCTHFIVGRDHAGVGNYYGTYDAQRIFDAFGERELGITPLFFENAFHCSACGTVATAKTCPHGDTLRTAPSGTLIRGLLAATGPVPETLMHGDVLGALKGREGDGTI